MPNTDTPLGTGIGEQPAPALSPGPSAGQAPGAVPVISRSQIWLHRLLVLLFVFVCAASGVLLVIVPWLPQWTDNSLLLRYPDLRPIIGHGFFRGVCSGLGLLDIWIGFSEAVHYHEG